MITEEEKALLDRVLEFAGDNKEMVPDGIERALRGVRGEKNKARKTHLWSILSTAAKERISRARRKFSVAA